MPSLGGRSARHARGPHRRRGRPSSTWPGRPAKLNRVAVKKQIRKVASKCLTPLLARMAPELRQRLVLGLLARVVQISSPAHHGLLFRTVVQQSLAWPTSDKADELHTAGLYSAVRETAHVKGVIVECGVGHGKSLVTLARAVEQFCPEKVVLGFDSFAGFPIAQAKDVGRRVREVGVVPRGWTDTSVELVRASLDAPAKLVPGFFEHSLAEARIDQISLLHVDCDMYESTKTVLKECLGKVSEGGLVILDEYQDQLDRWPGASAAVDEELAATGLKPEWEPALQRFVVRV